MSDDKLYKKAEERADAKIGFYRNLYAFVTVTVFFVIINVLFSFGSWWFYWVVGLWAIALVFHFLKVFVFADKMDIDRDQMIENEMKKMKK